LKVIQLPPPALEHGMSVSAALGLRKTIREFSGRELSIQQISNILWAAFGVNRKSGPFGLPGRTAASASNSQEIYVYVATKEGTYLYEPGAHRLIPVASGDIRPLAIGAGQAPAGATAPVRLIYVVDLERFKHAGFQEPGLHDPEIQKSYYFVDTGIIAQNVYVAASSLGLATWFHNCNRAALEKKLDLKPHQRALFGQTIGYEE